jgi:hydroxymethylbilane synthase
MHRLGLESRISAIVPVDIMVPAPGQGIVAIECADTASSAVVRLVQAITDADAMTALVAERAVVQALGGDCRMPLGVLATIDGQTVTLRGSVASPDGRRVVGGLVHGRRGNPAALGEKLAAELEAKGAGDILSPATS